MKLIASEAFNRDTKRFIKRNPQLKKILERTLELLEADIFHPRLKTHKLHGRLKDCWACSVAYDIRIVFEFVQYEDEDVILLHTIGSHKKVY